MHYTSKVPAVTDTAAFSISVVDALTLFANDPRDSAVIINDIVSALNDAARVGYTLMLKDAIQAINADATGVVFDVDWLEDTFAAELTYVKLADGTAIHLDHDDFDVFNAYNEAFLNNIYNFDASDFAVGSINF